MVGSFFSKILIILKPFSFSKCYLESCLKYLYFTFSTLRSISFLLWCILKMHNFSSLFDLKSQIFIFFYFMRFNFDRERFNIDTYRWKLLIGKASYLSLRYASSAFKTLCLSISWSLRAFNLKVLNFFYSKGLNKP